MLAIRQTLGTIGYIATYTVVAVTAAVGFASELIGFAPLPEPYQTIIEDFTHTRWVWVIAALWIGAVLTFRTYKSFKALDDIGQLRLDMTQATQTITTLGEQAKRHLDEAERLSDAFWEDSRSGAKVLWEVLYLTACAKPEIESRVAAARQNIQVWGNGGGVVSTNEFERGPDDFDVTIRRMLGSGPGQTIFEPLPPDHSWKPGDYPTRTMFLQKIQAQINSYEYALSAIDSKVREAAMYRYKMLQAPQVGGEQ